MKLDIDKIRNDFPILKQKIFGNPLIYFDNAATTQKPNEVIDIMSRLYRTQNANIHRGVHLMSQQATEAHEEARRVIAHFIGAASSDEVLFTRGTTESINLVASTLSQLMKRGDEIIISTMEHHSNIVPWQMVAERYGFVIKAIPIDNEGNMLYDEYEKLFTERTSLVSVTHVSNVLGTINDVKKITAIAHSHGVPVVIDGAQAVAHLRVDVHDLNVDFYAFSGHKLYAPTGIGVLYGKREWLNKLPPYQGGGEMIEKVTLEKTTYNTLPYKFEAGTPDFIGSVGFAQAIKYLNTNDFDALIEYEDSLLRYATEKMTQIDGLHIHGTAEKKSGVISFNIDGVHHFDLGTLLDKTGIAIRTGHHCAQPLVERLGVTGTARVSFAFYNTFEEIDIFMEKLKRCLTILKG